MQTLTKINVLYSTSIEKVLGLSDFRKLFKDIEFKACEKTDLNLIKNSLLFIEYDEFKKLPSPTKNSNCSIIIYDPYEESFSHQLPDYVFEILNKNTSQKKLSFIFNKAYSTLKTRIELSNLTRKFAIQSKELHTINSIGIALSTERNVDKLLETILLKCREITESDSGSLYLVSEKEGGIFDATDYFHDKELIFKLAQNSSVDVNFKEMVLNLNKKSISGYVALTGKALNLSDVYHTPKDAEYSHNRSFDEANSYRCKSMLIVPMKNQKDEIIGAIQLINKKRDYNIKLSSTDLVDEQVIDYDENDEELVYSLASQAAILIDNTKLYHDIKNLFEGFIKASVTAIEARDPTTSGHSERVAKLTVGLAKKVDSISTGNFGLIKFSRNDLQQIKYASLLHDFGKIGVKEDVLIKAKKLYPYELELLEQRFKYIRKSMQYNLTKAKLDYIMEYSKEESVLFFKDIDLLYNDKLKQLDEALLTIMSSNEPTVLIQEASDKLKLLSNIIYEDLDNTKLHYITPYELESLSIMRGSLKESERQEIESHVSHTYEFLSKIPWTNEFKLVPEIAYSHHEKLDGTGYPRGVKSENIPIPSKMMAITDIYDALTASDRPYKKALPLEKALDILSYEVKAKKLDSELFDIFVQAKVYEIEKNEK